MADITSAQNVDGSIAHDLDGTGVNPVLIGGYASAAVPASVSADGDTVRAWFLRNGAQAAVLTAAGALIGGDAANGLDVDVTQIIPGTGATNLGKAEDAGHTTGDVGVMMLGVRNVTHASLSNTQLDYTPFALDNTGRLYVNDDQRLAQTISTETTTPFNMVGGYDVDIGPDHLYLSDGHLRVSLSGASSSNTYTTVTSSPATAGINLSKYYTLQVVATGAVTIWDVRLEGSIDNINFVTILTHTNATGSGAAVTTTTPYLARYIRTRCAGLTLGAGTNVIAHYALSQ